MPNGGTTVVSYYNEETVRTVNVTVGDPWGNYTIDTTDGWFLCGGTTGSRYQVYFTTR